MIQERAIIQHLIQDDLPSDVSKYLSYLGFRNSNGMPFTQAQINSLLHSARQETQRRQWKYEETCGIDREKNPCGDASDY